MMMITELLTQNSRFLIGILVGALATALAIAIKKHLESLTTNLLAHVQLSAVRWFLDRRWEKKYRRVVREEHRYLRFVGINQPLALHRPRLEDVFVDLDLQTTSQVSPMGSRRVLSLDQTFTVPTAIDRFPHVVVLGGPGAGKTTLLEYLTCVSCNTASRLSEFLPVFIPLRRCSSTGSFIDQLLDPGNGLLPATLTNTCPNGFFQRKLKAGKCLLLFDGLDEVLDEQDHVNAARQIESLSVLYPACRIVVTSRLAGWRHLLGPGFARFIIRDLSPRGMEVLVRQWHTAVILEQTKAASAVSELTVQQFDRAAAIAAREAEAMLEVIRFNPRLMQIAVTPLILSLMCLVYHTQRDLPRRRVDLYNECAIILLEEWDRREKDLLHADVPSLELKIRLLESVALHMFSFNIVELNRREILELLRCAPVAEGESAIDDSRTLRFFEERAGILVEKARDIYAFSHLTIQEYFAAAALRRLENGLTLLVEKFESQDAHEVILLYAGMMDADELIETLLSKHKMTDDMRYLLLAGRSAAEAKQLSMQVKARVVTLLEAAFEEEEGSIVGELQSILAELGIAKEVVRQFGDYSIKRVLGRGFLATVYLAEDTRRSSEVALKVFSAFSAEAASAVKSVLPALSSIQSPFLVRLLEYGEVQSAFFISMEYIKGATIGVIVDWCRVMSGGQRERSQESLNVPIEFTLFEECPLDWGTPRYLKWVANVVLDVSRALEALHRRGLIHQDVKPDNISWNGSKAVLLDWGLDARIWPAESTRITRSLVGTLGFTAPERFFSASFDHRSDIYSLGATLGYMLTGHRVLEDQIANRFRTELQLPPSLADCQTGVDLKRLFEVLVAHDPKDRPQDIAEVASLLEAMVEAD